MSRLLEAARADVASARVLARAGLASDSAIGSASKLSALPLPIRAAKIRAIEAARQAYGIAQERLAAEAGIAGSWYRKILVHPDRASDAVLARLSAALKRLNDSRRDDEALTVALVEATYGGFLAAVCRELGLDVAAVRALDPATQRRGRHASAAERRGAMARQLAVYLTNVSIGVRQRLLARVVGVTPAAVCQSLRTIEDLRDDPEMDALIEACAREVTGRAA